VNQRRADLAGLETRHGVGAIGEARPRQEFLRSTGDAMSSDAQPATSPHAACAWLIVPSDAPSVLTPPRTSSDTESAALKSP